MLRAALVVLMVCSACSSGDGDDSADDPSPLGDAAAGRPMDAALPRTDAARPATDSGRDSQVAGERADAGVPARLREVARLTTTPVYKGSVDNSVACSREYPTAGYAPLSTSKERFPLFLYFVGTAFLPDDPSAKVDSPAPMAVTESVAKRGFV